MEARAEIAVAALRKLAAVQALRGIATLSVVYLHASSQFGGDLSLAAIGNPAVDMFFLISGFLMVHLSRGRFGEGGAASAFLWRRLLRIVPLYWLLTTLALGLFFFAPFLFDHHKSAEWPWLVGMYLFTPIPQAGGSFMPIIGAGWTLTYEMAFYGLFAACLLLRRGLPVLFSVLLTAPVIGLLFPQSHPALAALVSPFLFEFALGAGVALMVRRVDRPAGLPLMVAGLTVIVLTMNSPDAWSLRPLAWGLPGALILAGAIACEPLFRSRLAAPIGLIGEASYSIYLGHVFTLPAIGLLIGGQGTVAALGATVLTVALCIGLWWFVERPLQNWSRRVSAQRQSEDVAGAAVRVSDRQLVAGAGLPDADVARSGVRAA